MKNKKIFSFLVVIVFMFLGNIICVSAATITQPYGVGKYTRGVSRISWWMSYENNGGWYEYQINNAINNWDNPGWTTPVNFVEASSNAGTMMDIYAVDWYFWPEQESTVTLAETRFYNSSSVDIGDPTYSNYVFTRIYLNDNLMHNLSVNEMRGTIAHEIGHTLGLKHNNTNANSIMCQGHAWDTGIKRAVQTVQQIDNTAVVNHYK